MSCKYLLLIDSKPSEVSDHPVRQVITKSFCSLGDRQMDTNSPVPQRSPLVSVSEQELWCLPSHPFSYMSIAHLNFLFPLSTTYLLLNLPGTKIRHCIPMHIAALPLKPTGIADVRDSPTGCLAHRFNDA